MPDLEIRLLGDIAVLLDGEALSLPPSQKTRALLAYLALARRPCAREQLCDLLWQHADDPRGALRWSLSRLRAVVDQGEQRRVIATRRDAALDLQGARVDALDAAKALQDLAACPTDALAAHVRRLGAELAADLDLDDCPEFTLWLAAERERCRGLKLGARRALIDRLAEDPEAAIPHLRDQVRDDPLDEEARARLIRTLGATGRLDEAEAQMQAARVARRAAGAEPTGEVGRAWRDARSAPVARVAPRAAAEPQPGGADLIGRGPELSWLLESLQAALSTGTARVVLVTGEPGVGKSRLLSALLENARGRGVSVLLGRAHEVELRPYGPWVDALRHQRLLTEPEWRRRLGPLVGEGEPELGGKERLFAAMSELVAQLAGEGGAVLALDDVHWADEASTSLMHFVTRSVAQHPVLTVLIARDGELAEHAPLQRSLASLRRSMPVDSRRLGPLDPAATMRLVHTIDPDADATEIHKQSAGNPLLTLELTRSGLSGSGQAVGALIRDRLLALPEEARELLRWAAVLGAAFSVERLADVAPCSPSALVGALGALQTHALLVSEDDGLRAAFAHDLVWRTVYADLAPAQRRLMHRRVADLLGGQDLRDPEIAAELARHAELAGDVSAAARACVLAGQHCVRVFANAEARALAERGLRCAEALRDPEKVEREIELMGVAMAAEPPADVTATLARLDAMAERAVDYGSVAHGRSAYSLASTLRFERNQWTGALLASRQAERIGRLGDLSAQVAALSHTARCLLLLERELPQADAMAREARALARQVGRATPSVPLSLGMLAAWRGDAEEAQQLLEEARRAADRDGDRLFTYYALEQHVILMLELGHAEEAERLARDLIRIGDRIRDGSEAPFARALLGLARLGQGADDAYAEVVAAIEALEAADARFRVGYAQTRLAAYARARGSLAEARARAEAGLSAALLLRRPSEEAFARVELARIAHETEDLEALLEQRGALMRADAPVSCAWSRAMVRALSSELRWPIEQGATWPSSSSSVSSTNP